MPRKNLPYVNRYKDRTGKMRYYVRRPGCRQVALKGEPGSREFLQSYAAVLSVAPTVRKVWPKIKKGHVYYAEMGDLIKIGFTINLKRRQSTYRTHAAKAVQIIASEPGTMYDEKRMHQRFAAHRVEREWFRRNPELLAHIANLTLHNSAPD